VKYFLSAEALTFAKAGTKTAEFDEDDVNSEFSQASADDDAPF
jgi:hypothetical protein